jgi:hypothetical protein
VKHKDRLIRNVTITLDDETARWARMEAARNNQSISGFIRSMLRARMDRQTCYEHARERYLLDDVTGTVVRVLEEARDEGLAGYSSIDGHQDAQLARRGQRHTERLLLRASDSGRPRP